MKRLTDDHAQMLRRALRAGDPAADDALLDVERVRRVWRAALRPARPRGHTAGWLALAGATAMAVAAWVVLRPVELPVPADGALPAASTLVPLAGPATARQMQFETPGGTRVIWIVTASLDLK